MAKERKTEIKPIQEKYNEFIQQIELEDIMLVNAKIDNLDTSYIPEESSFETSFKAEYTQEEEGFCVLNTYRARVKDISTKTVKARLIVSFQVDYSSKIEMDDELFDLFKVRNLIVNTWPYFREFAQSSTQRMGWPPYVAPVFRTTQ
jgi:hypothetical protein